MLNSQVTSPGLLDSVDVHGEAKPDVAVEAYTQPFTFPVAPTSFVSSSCAGDVLILAPQSAPERVTDQDDDPMVPDVVHAVLPPVVNVS
jgi:hypothetical protein